MKMEIKLNILFICNKLIKEAINFKLHKNKQQQNNPPVRIFINACNGQKIHSTNKINKVLHIYK